uniref:Ubiquitin-like domain-containing protein n=1 Tax=Periophthalmus magnuspinnatus TaxID=409849 RepID=A0A3B4B1B2_9GOBI
MGRLYQVVVTGFKGERMTVDLCNTDEQMRSMTVEQLKNKIAVKLPPNTGNLCFRISLIFADERLDVDSKLLSDYGIQHMSVIQLVLQVDGGLSL